MSDLVERLEARAGVWDDRGTLDREAKAEIEQLRAEIERLRANQKLPLDNAYSEELLAKRCAKAEAEVERLREERDQLIEQISLRKPSVVERDMQEIMRINNELKAEIERLQAGNKRAVEQNFADHAEIERLTADKTAISQTASDYLHENERLRALVVDLANELEGEVEARYVKTKQYPGEKRRYERDMDTVWKARRTLGEKG